MSRRIDFLISNDRHHPAMFLPVARRLRESRGDRCRVVSLCELRGLASPEEAARRAGIELVRVVPAGLGRARSGLRPGAGGATRRLLRMARPLAWRLLLRRRLAPLLVPPPDLAVVPNDAAYPYDRIAALFRRRRIPFLLVQEGVRYAEVQTRDPGVRDQGRGGAAAVAVWGETSAAYFRRQGVPADRIIATGNPRFDSIPTTDWEPAADELRRRHGLQGRVLLFLSNPIETHGLCTHEEKLELVRRFVAGLGALFDDPAFRVVVKLHAGESPAAFAAVLAGLPHRDRVLVLGEAPLYPLLALADAAVVLTSSAGLEALLFGLPLGVVEIPGAGWVHDYVRGGGASGISWSRPIADQVRELFASTAERRQAVAAYLGSTLADRRDATGRVAELADRLVRRRPAPPSAG